MKKTINTSKIKQNETTNKLRTQPKQNNTNNTNITLYYKEHNEIKLN